MNTWLSFLWRVGIAIPATGEEPMGLTPYIIAGAAILLVVVAVLLSASNNRKKK